MRECVGAGGRGGRRPRRRRALQPLPAAPAHQRSSPAAAPPFGHLPCRWSIHRGNCGFGYINEDQPAVSAGGGAEQW